MTLPSRRSQLLIGILATLALTALSIAAVAVLALPRPGLGFANDAGCPVPGLAGTVVTVAATDMGGPMMGGPGRRGGMRLTADRATVPHGYVTFLVTNAGRYTHEMVILPLPGTQLAGTRPVGGDGRIDEAGSLGEASSTCAEGAGQGILPHSSGWVTVDLPPGRYELVCNFAGHYAAGMYTQLTVS
ncbi:Uncharacterized copper-binding protein, cupredoxin-like subfamily [Arthrobacter sp. ok909]|uniref:sulfocyanin-like copper-binding protein n=1 Tax=Arthrobacter sp. ok909 TaxID=1761746 RepID=UPI00087FE185|nr:sulfocyanin-like copper-binding protein [Arthrobacter sp. ok909]SDP84811.1 Uncharacterized copper-binding protein, cupredoxin-like subfamily [Arthrobacter sp. ok909]